MIMSIRLKRDTLHSSLRLISPLMGVFATAMLMAGTAASAAPPAFKRCTLTPALVTPGQACVFRTEVTGTAQGIELRQQYYVAAENVPPGFHYDPSAKLSYLADRGHKFVTDGGTLDTDPQTGAVEVRLDTSKWRPGLYYFLAGIVDGKKRLDQRGLAVRVPAPGDQFDVSVSASWEVCSGTHPSRVIRVVDGTLLTDDCISTDHGQTWQQRKNMIIGTGGTQLRDGLVIGMAYRTLPIDGREGWYAGQRFESSDHGRTITGPLDVEFHVPQAKAAQGHAFHPGPLFMRSIVERSDGSLVALMGGWFKGDDAPCPHSPKRPYSRTYTCESKDRGKTWEYVSTIGYDHIGSEGYNEGTMKALPDGRLMAVIRTGSASDIKCQDNPVMSAFSDDGGRTWSKPQRTGGSGAFPDLLVLSDGTLVGSYGRPGNAIMFSTDHGQTWTDHTIIDPTPYSGYTALCEPQPGEVLVVFGGRDYFDPVTGKRSDSIRCARVTFKPKSKSPPTER